MKLLYFLNKKLRDLSLFQIFEVHFIVLIIFSLPSYYYLKNQSKVQEKNFIGRKSKIRLKVKHFNAERFLGKFESLASKNSILILDSKLFDFSLDVNLRTKNYSFLSFLRKSQKINKHILLSKINFTRQNNFYMLRLHYKYSMHKIFYKRRKQTLKLFAILANYVKINQIWYKIGSKIQGYKISKKNNNEVVLSKKGKNILLRIFNEFAN